MIFGPRQVIIQSNGAGREALALLAEISQGNGGDTNCRLNRPMRIFRSEAKNRCPVCCPVFGLMRGNPDEQRRTVRRRLRWASRGATNSPGHSRPAFPAIDQQDHSPPKLLKLLASKQNTLKRCPAPCAVSWRIGWALTDFRAPS